MKPTRIGKYTAFEKIGRGSTSEVYKAYDPILNRFVAIKTIIQGADINEELRARFYREAQSAARLSHPNIITVYELGEDQQRVFIVMELLVGSDLKQFIQKRKTLTFDQKLELMQQIAAGIGFAHSKGIVHRDLKPGNIHVQSSNHVKIMDFGLARLASSGITRSGMVMGTPNYMSPEQVRGETVDMTSDVFSMGAILYELFGFKKPFQADSLHATMMKVMRGEREPLSKVVPDIHPALAEIVDKALELEPHDRYRNGNELFEALSELRNEAVSAKKSSPDTLIDSRPNEQSSADTEVGEEESNRSLRTPLPSSSEIPLFRSLSGSLKAMHLADLLQWCAIKSKTGTLRIRHGPIEKKTPFQGRSSLLFLDQQSQGNLGSVPHPIRENQRRAAVQGASRAGNGQRAAWQDTHRCGSHLRERAPKTAPTQVQGKCLRLLSLDGWGVCIRGRRVAGSGSGIFFSGYRGRYSGGSRPNGSMGSRPAQVLVSAHHVRSESAEFGRPELG